jgi:anti-sigma B factor antagonist
MTNRFECDIDNAESGGECVLTVRGDVDLASAPDFETTLRTALDSSPSSVTIDLAALTFIDSSGLRVLVSASKDAQSRGATLGLRNVPRHAQRVLDITGLSEWFDGQAANEGPAGP